MGIQGSLISWEELCAWRVGRVVQCGGHGQAREAEFAQVNTRTCYVHTKYTTVCIVWIDIITTHGMTQGERVDAQPEQRLSWWVSREPALVVSLLCPRGDARCAIGK